MIINNRIKSLLASTFLFLCVAQLSAHINPNRQGNKPTGNNVEVESRMQDCTEPTAQVDQNVNNVRARLTTGGDVWWDPQARVGRYVVPAVPVGSGLDEISSIFVAAVWLGGFDAAGNLKLAATDFRSAGNTDFYPGPLDEETGITGMEECQQWDRFFEVQGTEIEQAIRDWEASTVDEPYDVEDVPPGVRFWPGNDNPHFRDRFPFDLPSTAAGLGAYWDEDQDGIYNPVNGDFPIIEIRGCEAINRNAAKELVPDEMIFWIYNDAGNTHTLTRGDAINMEIQVQSFAYSTNDEINDMTFQRYKLINRATTDIRDTYFGWFVDPDLGCFQDDYSGCDVSRSLAFTYNEDELDGNPGTCDCGATPTYCDEVPMIGTDYFRGPLGPFDIVDCAIGEEHVIGIADEAFDEDIYAVGDTICILRVDPESLEEPDIKVELGMSSFIVYNNGGVGNNPPQTFDPANAEAFYSYLTGRWNDDTPLTVGGTGFNPGSTDVTLFAFPDPPNQPGGWSMAEEALPFGDRRTVQASGPFLLRPGDRNELIIGAVWVPDVTHPRPSLAKLQAADDVAQNLFDACFDIVDGPDAPDLCTIELDREIIIVLTNDTLDSNNAFEAYSELDILSSEEIPEAERMFEFEGYQVFQLRDQNVSPQELDDVERAILVAQVDVENGINELFNWSSVPNPVFGTTDVVWTPTREVDGADEGIRHTFSITTDAFATGDTRLINHETYFYMVVAYAHNNFATFDQQNPTLTQQNPYLEGRGNVRVYSATPRPIVYQGLNSQYGDGVPITRISGVGVGGNVVDLDDSMYETILDGSFDGNILYESGAGPIDVRIFNPLDVQDGVFRLEMQGEFGGGTQCGLESGVRWVLTDVTNNVEIASEQTIDALNEQIITDYGISISIGQTDEPGETSRENNGAIAAFIDYADAQGVNWYNAARDDDASFGAQITPIFNFLQTGVMEENESLDPNGRFGTLGDGFFYPFTLSSGRASTPTDLFPFYMTPGWKQSNSMQFIDTELRDLNNVDIIFTADKSLWSECIVVETATEDYLAVGNTLGGTDMFDLRETPSIDQNGNPLNDGTVGKSYFPGYAVDVETGRRLNIFFGENSLFPEGQDLIYNPSDSLFVPPAGGFDASNLVLGGHHYIYVTRQEYDGCAGLFDRLEGANSNLFGKIDALKSITWASMSYLLEGNEMLPLSEGLIPNDVTIKLRVENPYNLETTFNIQSPNACVVATQEQEFPVYEFELSNREAVDLTQEPSEGILSDVNVVPNPYYAFSTYEVSKLDKAVLITNVPDQATVTIYSLDGKFIQQFRRDERPAVKEGANPGVSTIQTNPDIRWDLENFAGIPIASGVYLIHISALGEERTLKWFGINRQFDASGL
jgi:hypothetical protein